ncbi:hypothetical protein GGR57DRAFT_499184 [Xylariaceae sp. FL1272]|nr:hypothetical protein GGR57DRAFT_499184 [Xylariaceae sp. FL1272]
MDTIVQPSALDPDQFLGLTVAFGAFTTAVVGIRLSSNLISVKRLNVEDYFCVVAFVFVVLNIYVSYLLVEGMKVLYRRQPLIKAYATSSALNADPREVSERYFATVSYKESLLAREAPRPITTTKSSSDQLGAIATFTAGSAVYTAKLPLLFLFIRIFGVKDWLRRTCKALVFASILGFLGSATYVSVRCSPDLHEHDMRLVMSCVSALARGCSARCALSLVIDIIMFFLPLPVVQRLQLPIRRRIGLALVFMTGFLAVVASAMGLYYQTMQSTYSSTNFVNALGATVLESCVVLLVSCTASLHQLWAKIAAYRRARLSRSGSSVKSLWSGSSGCHTPNPDEMDVSSSSDMKG